MIFVVIKIKGDVPLGYTTLDFIVLGLFYVDSPLNPVRFQRALICYAITPSLIVTVPPAVALYVSYPVPASLMPLKAT